MVNENNGTRVDLGDDLLEEKADSGGTVAVAPASDDLEGQLQSASILMGEGMLEDAKKILRKILIADSHYVAARAKLDEIHQNELRQIFADEPMARFNKKNFLADLIDTRAVVRSLDHDLKLGIFSHEDRSDISAIDEFARKLDVELADVSTCDRIDIGIAFLEMGLFRLANRQFRVATLDVECSRKASALLAYGLILEGRAFDAILCIEPLLLEADITNDEKIEFAYLMGRANEDLHKVAEALRWYGKVCDVFHDYRDAGERMRLLTERMKANA
jgi:tetratricopeptide (TPR) repeat protein